MFATFVGVAAGLAGLGSFALDWRSDQREQLGEMRALQERREKSKQSSEAIRNAEARLQASLRLVEGYEWRKEADFLDKNVDPNCEAADCKLTHRIVDEYALHYTDSTAVVVAIASYSGQSCHSCGVYLSFIEFERKADSSWSVAHADLAVVQWGAWGRLRPDEYYVDPDLDDDKEEPQAEDLTAAETAGVVRVYAIGANEYGVFLGASHSGMGETVRSVSVFARVGDTMKEVLQIDTGYENPGTGERLVAWTGTWAVEPANTGLYDIVVRRQGTGLDRDRRGERFRFDGRSYAVVE